jgi:hypothetical protein
MTTEKSLSEEINSINFGETRTFSLRDLMKKTVEQSEQSQAENKSKDDFSPYNTSNS